MLKDFLGIEIKPGDYVVYPGRRGSSLWMNLGVVEKVSENSLDVWVPAEAKVDPRWHAEINEGRASGKYTQYNSNREWPEIYYLPQTLRKVNVFCIDRVTVVKTFDITKKLTDEVVGLLVKKKIAIKNDQPQ